MIENKELPSEYVSIRQVWLMGINDCRRAIGQRVITEAGELKYDLDAGERTIVYTVHALYYSLVDYGEALVRSDVDKWYNEVYKPRNRAIWEPIEVSDEDRASRSYSIKNAWDRHALLCEEMFDFIIQTLNKYGMLFLEQPKGYSNVEMKSV